MKKLICAKEMEEFLATGNKKFYVSSEMIITPSAKDVAKNNGIEFTMEQPTAVCTEKKAAAINTTANSAVINSIVDGMDSDTLMQVFKAMMDKGLLQEMLACLSQGNKPYRAECHHNGLKVVRGESVKMDVFDTGDPKVNAHYQELVSKEESKMSAGFLTIEDSRFEWELTYEEIDYVIEGTLTVEIDGKTFTAHAGDVLFVPSGSKVVWGSPDKARVFYATYPANWADLL